MAKPKLIPISFVRVTEEKTIIANGEYDVQRVAKVIVNVPDSGGGSDTEPIGDENIVNVISWADFQNIDKTAVVGQIYSIEL